MAHADDDQTLEIVELKDVNQLTGDWWNHTTALCFDED